MKLKIGTQGYVPIFRLCGETLPRMSFILRCLPLGVFLPIVAFGQGAPHTMRIDYYHSGNVSQELFSLDRVEIKLFAGERYRNRVGAFEGAMYEAKGYYRSQVDCIMFTRSHDFCDVCRRAIERIIALYARG